MRSIVLAGMGMAFLVASLGAQPLLHDNNKTAVLYLGTTAPTIEGDLSDWKGLQGTSPTIFVFGSPRSDTDPSGFFVYRSDNKNLYILAEITDSVANENELPAPLAWRNDSVEVFIGTDTSPHNHFALTDNQIRLVPVSRSDTHKMGASINDTIVDTDPGVKGTVVYTATGYRICAKIPLRLLHIRGFKVGQHIRAEFQINDATDAERENLVHWSSKQDNPYYDAGSWGNGVVEAYPGDKK